MNRERTPRMAACAVMTFSSDPNHTNAQRFREAAGFPATKKVEIHETVLPLSTFIGMSGNNGNTKGSISMKSAGVKKSRSNPLRHPFLGLPSASRRIRSGAVAFASALEAF